MKQKIFLLTLFLIQALFLNGHEIKYWADGIFLTDNPPLIASFSTRAACTSVLTALCKACNLENRLLLYKNIHDYYWNEHYKLQYVTSEKFFNKKYYKLKFVRNPYTRAVSSYLFCINHCPDLHLSFEEFLKLLVNNKWDAYNIKPTSKQTIMYHCKVQSTPFDQFMDIIQIESPEEHLKEFYKKSNIKIDLTTVHLNATDYTKESVEYVGNIPFKIEKEYPPYYAFYSNVTVQLIEEIYNKDLLSFQYKCPQEIINFIETMKTKQNLRNVQ